MSGIATTAGGIISNAGAGIFCGLWGCKKALEPSSSRLRFRDVLGEEQMTGGKLPRLCLCVGVAIEADIVADSANPVTIGAIAVLGFLVGLSIVTIFARVMRRRRDSKRISAMVADQEWHCQTGTGVFAVHIP